MPTDLLHTMQPHSDQKYLSSVSASSLICSSRRLFPGKRLGADYCDAAASPSKRAKYVDHGDLEVVHGAACDLHEEPDDHGCKATPTQTGAAGPRSHGTPHHATPPPNHHLASQTEGGSARSSQGVFSAIFSPVYQLALAGGQQLSNHLAKSINGIAAAVASPPAAATPHQQQQQRWAATPAPGGAAPPLAPHPDSATAAAPALQHTAGAHEAAAATTTAAPPSCQEEASASEAADRYAAAAAAAASCDEDDEDYFDPYLFISRLPPLHHCTGPEPRAPLLPRRTRTCKQKTLVLDLDETLVHSTLGDAPPSGPPPDFSFHVTFAGQRQMVHVRRRPHMAAFLEAVAEMFEVVVFTASQKLYAEKLLNLVDPARRLIRHRIYRDSCVVVAGNYLKDLSALGRDLRATLIVDNSPQAFGFHLDNGVPIASWYDDASDTELLALLPFLAALADAPDVRPAIAARFALRELVAHAAVAAGDPPPPLPPLAEAPAVRAAAAEEVAQRA